MGLKNCTGEVQALLDELSTEELKKVLLDANRNISCDVDGEPVHRIVIDVDVSIIFHKLHVAGDSPDSIVMKTARFLIKLSKYGFIVTPICDGKRSGTKLDSVLRKAKSMRSSIKSRNARYELVRQRQLAVNDPNTYSGPDFEKNLKKLERTGSKKPRAVMRPDFPHDLQKYLQDEGALRQNEKGGFVCAVIEAEFQADCLLAKRYKDKKCSIILSSDTDFLTYVGTDIILLCSHKFLGGRFQKYEDMHISQIRLMFASNVKLRQAATVVENHRQQEGGRATVTIKPAKYDIFGRLEHQDPRTRALMAVGLGCDVLPPSGVHHIGPTFFDGPKKENELTLGRNDTEESEEGSLRYSFNNEKLTKFFACVLGGTSKNKVTSAMMDDVDTTRVNAYVEALLYEPVNEKSSQTRRYLHSPPTQLTEYCSDFCPTSAESFTIVPQVLITCPGPSPNGNESHKIMKEDTYHNSCHGCHTTICKFCVCNHESLFYCCKCYAAKATADVEGFEYASMTKIELANEIKRNAPGGAYRDLNIKDISLKRLQDLYVKVVLGLDLPDVCERAKFPLQSPEEYDADERRNTLTKVNIPLQYGSFISDVTLRDHVPDVIIILSDMIDFNSSKHYVPQMFCDIAQRCRTSKDKDAHRLLERFLRHVTDPKMQRLALEHVEFFKCTDKEQIGLSISTNVPASMQDQMYCTTSSIRSDGTLLCAKCNCKVGGHKKERFGCVHTLPCLGKLTVLLTSGGLSDDILFELQAMIADGRFIWDTISVEKRDRFERSVRILIASSNSCKQRKNLSLLTIGEILAEHFSVGTDRTRCRTRIEVDPRMHRPLVDLQNESVFKKGRRIFNLLEDDLDADDENPSPDHDELNDPAYDRIQILLNHIHADTLESVGHSLLRYRANKFEIDMQSEDATNLCSRWDKLLQEASFRSMPSASDTPTHDTPRPPTPDTPTHDTPLPSHRSNMRSAPPTHCSPPITRSRSNMRSAPPTRLSPPITRSRSNMRSVPPTRLSPPITRSRSNMRSVPPTRRSPPTSHSRSNRRSSNSIRMRSAIKRKPAKRKSPQWKRYCCFPKCNYTNLDPDTTFRRLPQKPTSKPKSFASKPEVRRNHCIAMKKYELWSKIGIPIEKYTKKDSRVCNHHIWKHVNVEIGDGTYHDIEVIEPKGILETSLPTLRLSREQLDCIKDVEQIIFPDNHHRLSDEIRRNLTKMLEEQVRKRTHDEATPTITPVQKKSKTHQPACVKPDDIDSEIQRRTGFKSQKHLLAYIIIVSDGDIDMISERNTELTWYEEWVFSFEFIWGRTRSRWLDRSKDWSKCHKRLHVVLRAKLDKMILARNRWPMYASHEEDMALRSPDWNSKYGDERLVFWDDTNINLNYKPSAAEIEALTYSVYYGSNCAKGGVAIQCAGWIRTQQLYTGGCSDTKYLETSGILKEQEAFAARDEVSGRVKPFMNVLDKGYRCTLTLFEHGQQTVMQPMFSHSDRQFTSNEALISSSVASDRAGNERAVNRVKSSWLIKNGVRPNGSFTLMNSIWIAYGFQVNFMYKSVF